MQFRFFATEADRKALAERFSETYPQLCIVAARSATPVPELLQRLPASNAWATVYATLPAGLAVLEYMDSKRSDMPRFVVDIFKSPVIEISFGANRPDLLGESRFYFQGKAGEPWIAELKPVAQRLFADIKKWMVKATGLHGSIEYYGAEAACLDRSQLKYESGVGYVAHAAPGPLGGSGQS